MIDWEKKGRVNAEAEIGIELLEAIDLVAVLADNPGKLIRIYGDVKHLRVTIEDDCGRNGIILGERLSCATDPT